MSVVRWLAWLLAVGAVGLGAHRGDPTSHDPAQAHTITVDATTVAGRVTPIWDEVNLWKLYGFFGTQHPAMPPPNWLRNVLPWASHARVVAALGGNYATDIGRWCDHGAPAPEHPYTADRDCGEDGTPGEAAANELVRVVDGAPRIDYQPFRLAIERLLESGVLPHLNLSSAPVAFTAPAMDFRHYHWNAAPVGDMEGWLAFVEGAFTAVGDLATAPWRVSIMNEANCLTLVGWERHRRHVGYAGSPDEYARTLVQTAAAIRRVAPLVRFHLGNFVTSDTFPGENNLALYMAALAQTLGAHPTLGWNDFDALSLSLYETPDTTVYELVPSRLGRAAAAMRAAGLRPLPFKIDELGIHGQLVEAFAARWGRPVDASLWAASWHAEALRVLLDAGTVVSVTPWFERLVESHEDGTRLPYPKAHVYELFGVLSGQLRTETTPDGAVGFAATERTDGLPRLAVGGEWILPSTAPRRHQKRLGGIGAVAAATTSGVRVLVTHHRNRPTADAHATRRRHAARVRVAATGLAPGSYALRRLAVGGPDGARWEDGETRPLAWHDEGCVLAPNGVLALTAERWMEANTVWLIEATQVPACRGAPPR